MRELARQISLVILAGKPRGINRRYFGLEAGGLTGFGNGEGGIRCFAEYPVFRLMFHPCSLRQLTLLRDSLFLIARVAVWVDKLVVIQTARSSVFSTHDVVL